MVVLVIQVRLDLGRDLNNPLFHFEYLRCQEQELQPMEIEPFVEQVKTSRAIYKKFEQRMNYFRIAHQL